MLKKLITKRFIGTLILVIGAVGKVLLPINPVVGTILISIGGAVSTAGFVDAAKRNINQ